MFALKFLIFTLFLFDDSGVLISGDGLMAFG